MQTYYVHLGMIEQKYSLLLRDRSDRRKQEKNYDKSNRKRYGRYASEQ